jgi:predicted CXXCH cytochrome family protein
MNGVAQSPIVQRGALVLLLCAAVLPVLRGAGVQAGAARAGTPFPHQVHERLFPVCEGCHYGVASDDAAATFPAPATCVQCHDGTRADVVDWQGAVDRPSLLQFSHARHLETTARRGEDSSCQACHATGGAPVRMAVGTAEPALCLRCHDHRADDHLARTVDCSRCHVSLAAAPAVSAGRIGRFPQPDWHADADFLSTHGMKQAPADASCSVCHARETCERCHANADALPQVAALPRDARVAALETDREPTYPVPASHAAAGWELAHGAAARAGVAACANCHTQPSCTACHVGGMGTAAAAVLALPHAAAGRAQGVSPALISSVVHAADIKLEHGTLAASGQLQCAQCHTTQQCASCHAGSDSRGFHQPNFVERHAVDVFAGRGSCQSCHTTETFCRACHEQSGVGAQAMNASFHDGQPMWVLSHGQAARRGLESCASCHRQTDCVRCHTAAGGWRVSPHGPGFDGSRSAARSAASCRLCHLTSPVRGN